MNADMDSLLKHGDLDDIFKSFCNLDLYTLKIVYKVYDKKQLLSKHITDNILFQYHIIMNLAKTKWCRTSSTQSTCSVPQLRCGTDSISQNSCDRGVVNDYEFVAKFIEYIHYEEANDFLVKSAIEVKNNELLKYLLENHILTINDENINEAVKFNNLEALKLFREYGFKPENQTSSRVAIFWAAQLEDPTIFNYLLPYSDNKAIYSAFQMANWEDKIYYIKQLYPKIDFTDQINRIGIDRYEFVPLSYNRASIIAYLIEQNYFETSYLNKLLTNDGLDKYIKYLISYCIIEKKNKIKLRNKLLLSNKLALVALKRIPDDTFSIPYLGKNNSIILKYLV